VDVIESKLAVLMDGATGTRLRLETKLRLDPVLDVAGLALTGNGRALRAVAGEYAAIAGALGLPIELDAMTYWASPDHLMAAGRSGDLEKVNHACIEAIASTKDIAEVYVAGVIGPREDGYRPLGAMGVDEATDYHSPQARALANSGADLLLGSTMSTLSEAVGVANAMAATGTAYVMAAVMRSDGCMPDGTSVADLVATIDSVASREPIHYLISCTHPSTALSGMRTLRETQHDVSARVIGIKANGSALDFEQLDGACAVLADTPMEWLKDMTTLRTEFDFRVIGGCCGTDSRHILALALDLC